MKKFKFSLPVAAFVLGIGLAAITSLSSFTKTSGKSGDTPTYYTLDASGNYVNAGINQPDYVDNCQASTATSKCVIEEPKDEGSSFSQSSIPETPVWTSPSDGFYSE